MPLPGQSDKRKLLLAGGGYADIPLIRAAQDLGFYVITSGNRPDELGHKASDEYRAADFSDPEAMLALARDLEIDAICPCCNDFSAISSAYVAEQLGLPGHDPFETTRLIHHKDSYRRFAVENGIPAPRASGFDNVETALSSIDQFIFPLIIKPVDLTGGKGITKIANRQEARDALEKAFTISKSGRVVVEEFIDGSRHGFSAFIANGRVVFHFTDNEYYYLNQYLVSAASTPSTVPDSAVQNLVDQSEKISELLSLETGIFHVQFILHNDEPVIIEICRRPPGDLYIKLVEHAAGIDYPSWIVKAFCGSDCTGFIHKEVDGFYLRHCIMAAQSGILDSVVIDPSIAGNIIDSMIWWKTGDPVDNHLVAKFGIVFLRFASLDELLTKSGAMQNLIRANIKAA
jgi:biotin carboxylase